MLKPEQVCPSIPPFLDSPLLCRIVATSLCPISIFLKIMLKKRIRYEICSHFLHIHALQWTSIPIPFLQLSYFVRRGSDPLRLSCFLSATPNFQLWKRNLPNAKLLLSLREKTSCMVRHLLFRLNRSRCFSSFLLPRAH